MARAKPLSKKIVDSNVMCVAENVNNLPAGGA